MWLPNRAPINISSVWIDPYYPPNCVLMPICPWPIDKLTAAKSISNGFLTANRSRLCEIEFHFLKSRSHPSESTVHLAELKLSEVLVLQWIPSVCRLIFLASLRDSLCLVKITKQLGFLCLALLIEVRQARSSKQTKQALRMYAFLLYTIRIYTEILHLIIMCKTNLKN